MICRSALYNNAQAKQYVDAWFVQVVRPFTALVQITGHNRARQRDKWAHILEDLSALQEEVIFFPVPTCISNISVALYKFATKSWPISAKVTYIDSSIKFYWLNEFLK